MGNYSDYHAKDLEPVQLTPELRSFLQNLKNILETQAALRMNRQEDRVHLKGYFEDPEHPGSYIEMDMLKDWSFTQKNGKWSFSRETGFEESNQITKTQNEILSNIFSIDSILKNDGSQYMDQSLLLQAKCLMEMAKKGSLFVTKQNELIKDSHQILLGETGEVTMLPSLKDWSEEDKKKEAYLLAQQKLQASPHYEDATYTNELYQASINLSTFILTGGASTMSYSVENLIDEAHAKNMSRAQFLAQIRTYLFPALDNNIEANYQQRKRENENLPSLKLSLSTREKSEAEELSKKALEYYASVQYDLKEVIHPLEKAAEEGEFNQEEFRKFNSTRDILSLLLDFGTDSGTQRSNIDNVKLMMGIGLNPNDPNYEEDRKRMFAQCVNRRLKAITEFEYEKYINLSDRDFVEKYRTFAPAFHRVSIMKLELDRLRENPYLDSKLVRKCYKIVDRYSTTHLYNLCKIRSMANPYYTKLNLKAFEEMDFTSFQQMRMSDLSGDLTFQKLSNEMQNMKTAKGNMLSDSLIYQMTALEKTIHRENIRFYNQQGEEIYDFYLPDICKKGELIFVADNLNRNSVTAFQPQKNTSELKMVPLTRKTAAAVNAIQANIDQNVAHSVTTLNRFFYQSQKTRNEAFEPVVREIIRKDLDPDQVFESVSERFQANKDCYTKGEFYYLFEKQGMKPTHLENSEVNTRMDRTLAANRACFDAKLALERSFNIANTNDIPFTNHRFFTFFLFDYQENSTYNEDIIRRFNAGEAERNEVIQEAFNRHNANKNLFTQNLTDDELVANWSQINETSLAFGQEYQNFLASLQEGGVTLNEKLKTKMDELHQAVQQSQSALSTRMSYIASRYYKYGAEDVLNNAPNTLALTSLSNDPEFREFLIARAGMIMHENNLAGAYLTNQYRKKNEEILLTVNDKGEALHGEQEMGQALRDNQGVFFLNNKGEVQGYKATDFHNNPPVLAAAEMNADVRRATESFKIDQKNLPDDEKLYQHTLLESQCNLQKLSENPDIPDYSLKLKETLANYCAAISIHELVISKNGTGMRQEIANEKTLKAFASAFKRSDLMDTLIKKYLPESPADIAKMNPEGVYTKLLMARNTESEKAPSEWNKKREERQLSNQYTFAENELEPDKFFQTITREQLVNLKSSLQIPNEKGIIGLHHLTLSRMSLQSITIAMMLTQGYSVEEALAPENRADREKIGQAAINHIKDGDYKTVVQNLTIGLNQLCSYVDQKLRFLPSISPRNVLKPENQKLVIAGILLKDFSQEIVNAQTTFPVAERITSPAIEEATLHAEILGRIINQAGEDYHTNSTFNDLSSLLTKYIRSDILRKRIEYNRSLGDNQNKPLYEYMTENEFLEAEIIFSDDYTNMYEQLPTTAEGQQELFHLLKTDTLFTKFQSSIVKEGNKLVYKTNLKEMIQALDKKPAAEIERPLVK